MFMSWPISLGVELIICLHLTLVLLLVLLIRVEWLVWDPVERFYKSLAGWKSKLFSRGGRFTLLKRTMCSLPIYFMSLFTIPASIASLLEKIMRYSVWNTNDNGNGLH